MGDNKPKVLITGGTGFVGANLALRLQDRYNVTVYDNCSSGNIDNLVGFGGRIIYGEQGDIRDKGTLEAVGPVDVIVHAAAMTDATNQGPEVYDINVNGTRNVLEYAQSVGAKVVNISSSAVYGTNMGVMSETDIPNPNTEYGRSKLEAEKLVHQFYERSGLDATIVRLFNTFGIGEDYKGNSKSIVTLFLEYALRGEAVEIYGNGDQKRAFMFVDDVVRMLDLCVGRVIEGGYGCETFNLGSDTPMPFKDLAETIRNITGIRGDNKHVAKLFEGYQMHTQADMRLAREKLGFEPQYTLKEGIEEYMRRVMSKRFVGIASILERLNRRRLRYRR